ncbi:MAG: hypothetical protein LBG61_04870, partial [Burkholderiales bacterium]|nr:hypothetical protein [Burkholderiales bacterium]
MSVQKTYSLRRRWWSATFIIHLAFWMMAILVIIGTSWHIAERMVKESLFETGMLLMSARQDFQEPTPLQEDAPPPAGSPFAPDSSDIRISRYGIQYQMLLDSRIVHKSPRAPATAFATFPEDRSWIPPSPNRGRNLERRAKPDGSPRMRNHGLIRGFTRVSIDDRMWWVFIVKNPEDG